MKESIQSLNSGARPRGMQRSENLHWGVLHDPGKETRRREAGAELGG